MAETIDQDELQRLIEACQRAAFDFRATPEARSAAAGLSNELTDRAVRLAGADFAGRTHALSTANQRLGEVNRALGQAADDAAKRAKTLADIASVVKTLDDLLALVADAV